MDDVAVDGVPAGMTVADALWQIRRIERVRAVMNRSIDAGDWDTLEDLYTEDFALEVRGTDIARRGRAAQMEFLRTSFVPSANQHLCHHPEIDLVSADRATGRWASDRVYYLDEYEQGADGKWRLCSLTVLGAD